MKIPDHLTCLLRNLYAGKKQQLELMEQQTGSRLGKEYDKVVYCYPAYLLICRGHHMKCQTRWITNWNQYCWEKYQQLQICRWYLSNGRNWRETKEHLDEGEKGEWKSLKLNIQKKKKLRSWHLGPSLNAKLMGKKWKQWQISYSWAPKSLWMVTAARKLKDAWSLKGKLWQT